MIEPLRIQPAAVTAESEPTELVRELLAALGESPARAGLVETPRRVWESLQFLTSGYGSTPDDAVGDAIFAEEYDDIVLVKDISLFSLCEHHLLPFAGSVHVAYVPDGRIVGLSKLPRLVNVFARRLQVQERLTGQIARALNDLIRPRGVVVRIDAVHMCMAMRGVRETESRTVTETATGIFESDSGLYERLNLMLSAPPADHHATL